MGFVVALEGEAEGVKCNVIVPAALTRMAEGLDTSAYPPMEPEQVAPAVAWLCHDNCQLSGEMLISVAGRVARAFVAESEGVCRPSWTVEDLPQHLDEIRRTDAPWVLPVVPDGHIDHLRRSFAMTKPGEE